MTGKCDVWIGGQKYCSQCATTSERLTDGGRDARGDE